MLHGTGLPTHIALSTTNIVLTGPPILVQIAAITEIAHSAFNLDQIRVAIEERERFGGSLSTNDVEGDIDVDEGPPPKYPRGMLRFELTDGAITLPAIEYRPLTNVTLGATPHGLKVSILSVSTSHIRCTLRCISET
jgi:RecQ-mediated genome instability protein 1